MLCAHCGKIHQSDREGCQFVRLPCFAVVHMKCKGLMLLPGREQFSCRRCCKIHFISDIVAVKMSSHLYQAEVQLAIGQKAILEFKIQQLKDSIKLREVVFSSSSRRRDLPGVLNHAALCFNCEDGGRHSTSECKHACRVKYSCSGLDGERLSMIGVFDGGSAGSLISILTTLLLHQTRILTRQEVTAAFSLWFDSANFCHQCGTSYCLLNHERENVGNADGIMEAFYHMWELKVAPHRQYLDQCWREGNLRALEHDREE